MGQAMSLMSMGQDPSAHETSARATPGSGREVPTHPRGPLGPLASFRWSHIPPHCGGPLLSVARGVPTPLNRRANGGAGVHPRLGREVRHPGHHYLR